MVIDRSLRSGFFYSPSNKAILSLMETSSHIAADCTEVFPGENRIKQATCIYFCVRLRIAANRIEKYAASTGIYLSFIIPIFAFKVM